MKSETVLEARNVSFSYKGKDVLQNVNIVLRNGSIIGLTGPNGIGKTTLLSLFIGDLIPGSGSVTINGKKSGFDFGSLEAVRRLSARLRFYSDR